MDHIALDRAGPDNGDFNNYVVKTFWLHSGQRRHLGSALDLKYSDRVGLLHHFERRRIIFGNVGKIEGPSPVTTKLERVLHYRHHSKSEQIDFYDSQVLAIVL